MSFQIKKIAVLGGGQMGAGIAQVALQAGYDVVLFDAYPGVKEKAKNNIKASLDKLHAKGVVKENPESVISRLSFADKLDEVGKSSVEMVIEAVPEQFDIKAELFTKLDVLLPKETIFCSNTSSISITRLASRTRRAERFAGMHFMNPVPIMTLVELIRGTATSDEAFNLVKEVTEKMGKTFIVAQDRPGFAINRILVPMINEAFFTLGEGIATAEDIDKGMKLGTNQPMGPLTLADFVGLDTLLNICEVLHRELGEDKYRPAPLLRKYVEAGWWGRKVKRGVYKYE